ncbi:MAG: FkbM family methyltransferase [Spirochaetia bacterium]|nr:FkbM family methyltransferase [Spirochaetia bacterium]
MVAERGMTGATGNIYSGLEEFDNMGFVLHFLRPADLFLDVGANIGSYSVLAAGVLGCKTVSLEPFTRSFASLERNIAVNRIGKLVSPRVVAASDRKGTLKLATTLGAMNHVVPSSDISSESVEVDADTLDNIVGDQIPALIKIDVEGFEQSVIMGARRTLRDPRQQALLIELGGLSERFGVHATDLRGLIQSFGYSEVLYEPRSRRLKPGLAEQYNALFVKDIAFVTERVGSAKAFVVNGQSI